MKHDLNVMLFFDKSKKIPKNKYQIPNLLVFGIWYLINWNLNYGHKKSLEFLQGFKFLGG